VDETRGDKEAKGDGNDEVDGVAVGFGHLERHERFEGVSGCV
jgi:hypothetical protein